MKKSYVDQAVSEIIGAARNHAQAYRFNDDMIRRYGLPKDVFSLIHDLAYHHSGRDIWDYVRRAQAILRLENHEGEI